MAAATSRLIPFLPPSKPFATPFLIRTGSPTPTGGVICAATGQTGFFNRLGRLIKEKAKSDVEKIFSGFSKTRENLAVVDELLLYWNLEETDRVLDELEEVSFSKAQSRLNVVYSKLKWIEALNDRLYLLGDSQALLVSDFGPKISFKIVDILRDDIRAGKLKSGPEIKVTLADTVLCFSVIGILQNFEIVILE